ncbi:MAG: hypothetical protein ACKVK3_04045 [Acidimicrobiales bacterium]
MTSTTDDNDGRVWCFQCGNEYDEEITECTECGVPTTCDPPIDVSSVGDVDDDQLAYEFHEWTGQGRSTLDGMLTRSGIDHAWQGATLIVREVDEEAVDEAVAQAEIVAMPTLDLSQPTMVYELGELDDDQHTRLLRRLGENGLSHAFDKDGDLFVYEKDEEKIDEVFSGLDEADPDEREFGQGVPGVDPVNVMSDLFVAAARLRKNPNDAKGVVALVEVASIIEQMTLPYGLGADVWGSVVDQSADLSDVLSGDDDSGDVTIEEMSIQLHEFMRRLV